MNHNREKNMSSEKETLIQQLGEKWTNMHWPEHLPAFESPLNPAVSDLMMDDTFIAGYLSRVVDEGELDEHLWDKLEVNEDLTERIAKADDPLAKEYLSYKLQLDECIRLARKIIEMK